MNDKEEHGERVAAEVQGIVKDFWRVMRFWIIGAVVLGVSVWWLI